MVMYEISSLKFNRENDFFFICIIQTKSDKLIMIITLVTCYHGICLLPADQGLEKTYCMFILLPRNRNINKKFSQSGNFTVKIEDPFSWKL